MLKVKTLVRDSSINGKGLIADEDIPKGTITWEFFSGIDIVLDGLDLSDVDRKFVKNIHLKTNKQENGYYLMIMIGIQIIQTIQIQDQLLMEK